MRSPHVQKSPEDRDAFAGAGESDRHANDVRPLVVRCMCDQQSEVGFLDGGSSAEEVLEGAVDEVDRVGSGFAKQAAALEEVLEDGRRITQVGHFGHCGEGPSR